MKFIVLKFGFIAGLILAIMVFVMSAIVGDSTDFEKGESLGYIFTVSAFFTIYLGIRSLRDNYSKGIISFNKAFRTGLLITLIGCVFYTAAWMININFIDNSFVERYTEYYINKVQSSGKSQEEIEKEIQLPKQSMSGYNNPFEMAIYTFLEIFPVGLIISILCSFLMRRSHPASK